jgi:hypothetical protein
MAMRPTIKGWKIEPAEYAFALYTQGHTSK